METCFETYVSEFVFVFVCKVLWKIKGTKIQNVKDPLKIILWDMKNVTKSFNSVSTRVPFVKNNR